MNIRILADDLTGALDSAVAFASPGQGIDVTWRLDARPAQAGAVDVATREISEAEAVSRHAAFAPWLAAGEMHFKKIDSLLRGHVAAEIEACMAGQAYDRVVIAPAFPFHGRVTRAGRQWRLGPDAIVGPDLAAALGARHRLALARPGEAPAGGITVYDAETDADLGRIVEDVGVAGGRTLWIGTGGLASALAASLGLQPSAAVAAGGPFLGLVGTDNAVTAAQVSAFAARHPDGHIVVGEDVGAAAARLLQRTGQGAPSVVSVAAAGERHAVARHIDRVFAALLDGLPAPGMLLVTGGETLRAVCDSLRAERLVVESAIEPGLPLSRIGGGRFDGVATISKSGAFGDAGLFVRLCGGDSEGLAGAV
ncbi:four-carbon acid sugar kinase family protein [Labrys monachus]|uniref:Uncharacterized protein YgbK (DUF1537 family) n=1 Tax=Labrys monachus TaxID=217067 RepID=A0ABU0FF76_9HYPH|nr:four-carbon acid sugar kinase family protein [Labrys monachus]MDQ0393264.1 uncharacterized protein YgbK (DUF1537 family) [Labrys monachus]